MAELLTFMAASWAQKILFFLRIRQNIEGAIISIKWYQNGGRVVCPDVVVDPT